jgi:phage terminase small subunit
MPPLENPRHERFAQALFQGETADEAYVEAGFKANRGNACRLKANESIAARLAELQSEAAKDATVTVESLLRELEAARNQASNLNQLGAATQAIMGKAKIAGLLVQRVEERIEVGGPGAFDRCETAEEIAGRVIEEYIGTEAHRYLIDDEQGQELIALTLQTLTDLGAAFERYRVDVIRGNPPTDIRARELQARVRERQRKLLSPPPAPE